MQPLLEPMVKFDEKISTLEFCVQNIAQNPIDGVHRILKRINLVRNEAVSSIFEERVGT